MKSKELRGLSNDEVLINREKYGANVLKPAEKEPTWKLFLQTLTGPLGHLIPGWKDGDSLVFILEIAAVLSLVISCSEYWGLFGLEASATLKVFFEPLGIIIAIILATSISFFFEQKANKEFELLNQVNDEEPVQTYRNGIVTQVPKKDIVVGDIVILTTGEEVPADGKLLESTTLSIDESSLTGEPICSKTTDENEFDTQATFPSNHVMRGTKVMEGHGICRIFAVGSNTENGKVFESVQATDEVKTPLDEQFDRLGMTISIASYVIGIIVFVGRIIAFLNDGDDFSSSELVAYSLQSLMIAVTLVVCSVPEGLPMAVTLSLALSMRRMLKTNNLVRKMHACETMGATTVICTDKTGTLTQNKMQVAETMLDESNLDMLYINMAVNSTAMIGVDCEGKETIMGNPTEGALLLFLREKGKDYDDIRKSVKVVKEIPFSTEKKYMQTYIYNGIEELCLTKGAPEIVMGMCDTLFTDRSAINSRLLAFQNQGMRTLGFAINKHFAGVVAISDPVRNDVPAAITECLNAGVDVKIVTGDTPATAREIGRQIGLWTDHDNDNAIITGSEFSSLSEKELCERIKEIKIIARARPMDKKLLVETLQKVGEVVAVTGDGTNDAPAMKAAHVGLSMGDGTSVAKEASDITIIDNSFSSIGRAVMWGRSLYQNIQRFILFQLTVNVAACLIVLVGSFMGTESPLTVTQMLWVNLIMDTFAAMALASLPPSREVMKHQPRNRKAFIISWKMCANIFGYGLLFFVITIGMLLTFKYSAQKITSMVDVFNFWIYSFDADMLGISNASASIVSRHTTTYELSLLFTTFIMLQFWNIFNARAFGSGRSAFHLKGCKGFIFIAASILIGQIAIMNVASNFFNVVPISLLDWTIIIAFTSLTLWIGEAIRMVFK